MHSMWQIWSYCFGMKLPQSVRLFNAYFHQVVMLFIKCWAMLHYSTLYKSFRRGATYFFKKMQATCLNLKGCWFIEVLIISKLRIKE